MYTAPQFFWNWSFHSFPTQKDRLQQTPLKTPSSASRRSFHIRLLFWRGWYSSFRETAEQHVLRFKKNLCTFMKSRVCLRRKCNLAFLQSLLDYSKLSDLESVRWLFSNWNRVYKIWRLDNKIEHWLSWITFFTGVQNKSFYLGDRKRKTAKFTKTNKKPLQST